MPVFELVNTEPAGWLHYELLGSGPQKVVMLTGFLTSLEALRPLVDTFSPQFDRFQFCCVDNRGVGGSSDPPSLAWTVRDMAADVLELVDALGWGKMHVLGVSMGGMIAQELAQMLHGRVASLTLIVTHTGGRHAIAPLKGCYLLTKHVLGYSNADLLIDLLYGQRAKQDADLRQQLREYHRRRLREGRRPTKWAFLCQLAAVWRHFTPRSALLRLRARRFPVLVITGDEDNLVRPANSHALAHALGVPVLVLRGAGHGLIHEARPQVHEALSLHLKAASASPHATLARASAPAPAAVPSPYWRLARHTSGPTFRGSRTVGILAHGALSASIAYVLMRAAVVARYLLVRLSLSRWLFAPAAPATSKLARASVATGCTHAFAWRLALLAGSITALRRAIECTVRGVVAWRTARPLAGGVDMAPFPVMPAALSALLAVRVVRWMRAAARIAARSALQP